MIHLGQCHKKQTGDPWWSKVSLLLLMEGTDGSTTITDSSSSPKTVTAYGNAHIEQDQYKFGSTSLYCDGTGDYAQIATNAAFGFGTGNFTIEYWTYPTRNTINETVIDLRASDTTAPLVLGKSSAGAARCYDGATVRTGGTITLNQWNHVAWVRIGTANTVYVNGLSAITFTNGGDFGSTNPVTIGSNVLTSAENYQGYIDEIRITKGVARYISAFDVPSAAFPTS